MVTLVQGKPITEYHAERGFDAKKIKCPICKAEKGEQCRTKVHFPPDEEWPQGAWMGGHNHIERAQLSRWLQMGLIDLKEIEALEMQEFGEKT